VRASCRSIVTSTLLRGGAPAESGYVHGFIFLAVITVFAVVAAVLIPTAVPTSSPPGPRGTRDRCLAADHRRLMRPSRRGSPGERETR